MLAQSFCIQNEVFIDILVVCHIATAIACYGLTFIIGSSAFARLEKGLYKICIVLGCLFLLSCALLQTILLLNLFWPLYGLEVIARVVFSTITVTITILAYLKRKELFK